jgi:hypothetical protein
LREGALDILRQFNPVGRAFSLFLLLPALALPLKAQSATNEEVDTALRHAVEAIKVQPHVDAEYDYLMTARVRLLFFWASKDDVGGGYIRRGTSPSDAQSQVLQLLMGSDPAKAPRTINRWGAGTEVAHRSALGEHAVESSTFFGFMKVSKGSSASEMQKEIAQEKQGGAYLFSAIVNESNTRSSVAKVVPFSSDQDYTIHQMDEAEKVAFQKLTDMSGRVRTVDKAEFDSCGKAGGFLSSLSDLIDVALQGAKTPAAVCYTFNGELFTLSLTSASKVTRTAVQLTLKGEAKKYERAYDNLVLAHFTTFNHGTKKESDFDLLLGSEGNLRGVPVQIRYQPNWWFQVVLNLKTPPPPGAAKAP